MVSYLIRRILLAVPVTLVVLTLIFLLMRVAPGDPAVAALGEYATQETLTGFREKMGLNIPLWRQYIDYLTGLMRGDLGRSLISGQPVSKTILHVLPYSLVLVISGVFIGITIGIPLGILSAVNRNNIFDYFTRIFSLAGISIPTFYLGILLLLLFAIKIDLFPVMGGSDFSKPLDNIYHLFLPALNLGAIMVAYLTRVTRSAMLEVISEDYIRTASSKGLTERTILYKHALRNVLIEVITVTGIYLVILIGGSVMVEIVFSRPGLGKMLVNAAKQRDYIVIQSLMMIYAIIVVIGNLLTDVSYGFFDPRIRYD